MSFLIAQGSGITQVEPEDELHVKVKLDGEKGGTDVRWIFSIAFTAAGTGNMQMSKYIACLLYTSESVGKELRKMYSWNEEK